MTRSRAFKESVSVLRALAQLAERRKSQSSEASPLRERLDDLAPGLSDEEQALLDGLSADLWTLMDEELGPAPASRHVAELAAARDAGRWTEVSALLRDVPRLATGVEGARLRAECWAALGEQSIADEFADRANRLKQGVGAARRRRKTSETSPPVSPRSAQVIIENPILNSPFTEPTRHFELSDDGLSDRIVERRRTSAYFVPVPPPRSKGKQLHLDAEWARERRRDNDFINRVRLELFKWRSGGYQGVTTTTSRLLAHWGAPDRERRLFFCQREAVETAIFLAEVAGRVGNASFEDELRQANEGANPGLFRIAFKMATGSGKTAVMAMLIAWSALNKLAAPQDRRFADCFLVVSPGITIRDRLRVLLPSDPASEYAERDLVPDELRDRLGRAKVVVTNFHSFLLRERQPASKLAKRILAGRNPAPESPFQETPDEMVRRVCRELGSRRGIVVLNDEAHHCYRPRLTPLEAAAADQVRLSRDERNEEEKRDTAARVWISGLEAVQHKLGIKVVYDLSATPFFLRGSGYAEGTLFPWVVSDFSLIDAIEAGIVKVPRVPVADDSMTGDLPTYRNLWLRIRDSLPKKGRGKAAVVGEPKLPAELEGALQSLYGNYRSYHQAWETEAAKATEMPPPVFIVVCNNTNVSKLVFDWIAGWDKPLKNDQVVPVPGKLELFSNVVSGKWVTPPRTVLIDSEQLESGEGLSDDFKKMAASEIAEWKDEYRRRFPGRDAEALTDADLLREVLNTVGKPGKLGEHVKCVVSVSMLTEGWDASTVTHILGVRAFGTQLLCEQVVGRGLRRRSYVADAKDRFEPEYAEVYGVPFSFLPCAGSSPQPQPPKPTRRVYAISPARDACAITFPRVVGYRYELPTERLDATFDESSRLSLTTKDIATRVDNAPIVGKISVHTLDDLKDQRLQTVDFWVARRLLEGKFRVEDEHPSLGAKAGASAEPSYLFPQLLRICRAWRETCLDLGDNAFPQLLLVSELCDRAVERIYRAIAASTPGERVLKPILRPYEPVGSTHEVAFATVRNVYETRADKCHLNRVVADTGSWEQKLAQTLEEMEEVIAYVKNQHLGFSIPYAIGDEQHSYYPDFIVRIREREGELNLLVEVTGRRPEEKAVKVGTARDLWVAAVNNHGGFGRWAFVEVTDPWQAKKLIRDELRNVRAARAV